MQQKEQDWRDLAAFTKGEQDAIAKKEYLNEYDEGSNMHKMYDDGYNRRVYDPEGGW